MNNTLNQLTATAIKAIQAVHSDRKSSLEEIRQALIEIAEEVDLLRDAIECDIQREADYGNQQT